MLSQRLRHRITIQQKTETTAASGEPIGFVWADIATDVPAEIVPLSGREFLAANAEQAETVSRATIRYRADITADMRVIHGALAHNITAILPDPTFSRHLTLMLSAGIRYDA